MQSIPARLVFYDGHCALCNRFINLIIRREMEPYFHFAPLYSKIAETYFMQHGIEIDRSDPDTLVVLNRGKVFLRSAAVIEVGRYLRRPYRMQWLRLFPARIRDSVYRLVARNRYRWFGYSETCLTPNAEISARLHLDQLGELQPIGDPAGKSTEGAI